VDRVIWAEHLAHTSEPGRDRRIIRERQIAILSAMAIGVNRNILDGEIVGDQERGIDQAALHLSIYPAKGYSSTLPIRNPLLAHTISLTDDEYKLVFSRLGDRLRVAGTAELNGFDLELN